MKKLYGAILSGIMAVILFFMTVTVQAAQINNGAEYPIATNAIEGWPQGPDLYAETAVLMDADTGAVLYNKGMNELRYPASITKIMTALLAIEHCSLDDQVTFTETCLADQTADSGNIGMQVGEVLTMKQCLLALMVKSANDVATQIAEYVGGSVSGFADMMNQRAQQIGCTNTHFVNASGMPDENHYTTAYDMALIFREAIKNDTFREIIGTEYFTIEPTNMNPETRSYTTHHALMTPSAPEYYEGCFGGKTGNTNASRNTLVSGAERSGMTLIAVALRADAGEVCQDHIRMFDYGFDNFERVEVPGGSVTIPKGTDVSGLRVEETMAGDVTGQAYYYQNDCFVGTGIKEAATPEAVPEVTGEPQTLEPETVDGESGDPQDLAEQQAENEKAEKELKLVYRYIIYILAGLVGVTVLIAIAASVRKRKRRR